MSAPAPRAWRTPATVLWTGALLLALSLGFRHAFGLFLAPMSRDNGWTREVFAFSMALQNLVWGLAQPFAGRIADRYGAGKTILGGALLYVGGLFLMSMARTGTALSWAGVLVGIGLSGTTISVVFGAILRATPPARRSVAMGIAMSVGSLGQFAMLPAAQTSIGAIGWTSTLVAMAAVGALMIPMAGVLAEPDSAARSGAAPMRLRAVLAEAFALPGFWLLCFGFFVCGFHVVFIATHLPSFLTDRGLGASTGATVLALVGLFNILGSYASGVLGGRLPKPAILVGIYASRAVVLTLFVAFPVTETTAWLFGAGMGLLWLSTVPPTNGTVATLFGVENMALLGGIVFLFHQVGAFLGGWLGGRLYVATGSYDVVWWLSIGLAVLAAVINVPIRETPVARLRARAGEAA